MINETGTKKGNSMDLNRQLIEAMADLNEDLVIATVRQMAAEGHSSEEIQQCLNTGISAVGTRFERGDYFIADLIVSGMIYRSALNEREPLRSGGAPRPVGKVVIGVVAGDIHDIGKDIIVSLLRAERFEVVDLGIDVKPERFVHAVRNYHPDVVLLSGVLAILIAIPVGVISAVKMNTWIDKLLSVITLIFVASPVFLTALVLMLVFALKLRWFPAIYQGNGLKEMILPAIALAMNMVALTSRITRTSMIEQLNADYIRTATAKGIPRRRVIITYALKNAMIPIITVTSIQVGSMLVGAVLVESVFAMGGLGDLLIKGIKAADYPVVQGVTLLMVFVFLCINLVVDILYAVLDPRIRMK